MNKSLVRELQGVYENDVEIEEVALVELRFKVGGGVPLSGVSSIVLLLLFLASYCPTPLSSEALRSTHKYSCVRSCGSSTESPRLTKVTNDWYLWVTDWYVKIFLWL